jgi:hypothetical protein
LTLATLLAHRCTIQRRRTGLDRFHQPVDEWDTVTEGVPCRLNSRTSGQETTSDSGRDVVQVYKKIYFGLGVDITEKDRVVHVLAPDGEELMDLGDVSVVAVVAKGPGSRHHVEVLLRQVRSPDG